MKLNWFGQIIIYGILILILILIYYHQIIPNLLNATESFTVAIHDIPKRRIVKVSL